jgi:hypothetical protein
MKLAVPRKLMDGARAGSHRLTGSAGAALLVAVTVVAGIAATGTAGVQPRLADVGAWLGSQAAGIVVHVNGLSGRPDGRVTVPGSAHHSFRVVQRGLDAYLVDGTTGQVSRIDPAQLAVTRTGDYRIGPGAQLVAGANVAYVVDGARGLVQRIDPTTLATTGAPLSLPAPLGQAGLDGGGTLWVPEPATGSFVAVRGGRTGATVAVGAPGDPLALAVAGGVPVAIDAGAATATVIGTGGRRLRVNLPSTVASPPAAGLLAPASTDGPILPLLAPASGTVVVVDTGRGSLSTVRLASGGDRLGVPQALGPRVYVPDQSTGSMLVFNRQTSQLEPPVPVTGHGGSLEAFVQGSLLWVNDEQGSAAVVVQPDGTVRHVGKYDTQAPGAGATAAPRPTHPGVAPPAAPAPPAPAAAPPSAPGTVTASSGPGSIVVTFTPSSGGSPTGYVLLGAPSGAGVLPSEVFQTGPFAFQVSGGSCSVQYSFQVAAVYPGGQVASAPTAPVRPCVAPGPPQALRYTPTTTGADLAWAAPADAAGSQPTYDLSWRGPSSGQQLAIAGTSASVTGLSRDGTYTFTVTAANAAGAGLGEARMAAALSGPAQGFAIYNDPVASLGVRSTPAVAAGNLLTTIPPHVYPTVTVLCQVRGGTATDGGDPTLTGDVWDRITYQGVTGYVSDLYVRTPMSTRGRYTSFSYPPLWQC